MQRVQVSPKSGSREHAVPFDLTWTRSSQREYLRLLREFEARPSAVGKSGASGGELSFPGEVPPLRFAAVGNSGVVACGVVIAPLTSLHSASLWSGNLVLAYINARVDRLSCSSDSRFPDRSGGTPPEYDTTATDSRVG